MKKNVVGHMMAAKEPVKARLRRWDLLPRLICVLLALVIWLVFANLKQSNDAAKEPSQASVADTQA